VDIIQGLRGLEESRQVATPVDTIVAIAVGLVGQAREWPGSRQKLLAYLERGTRSLERGERVKVKHRQIVRALGLLKPLLRRGSRLTGVHFLISIKCAKRMVKDLWRRHGWQQTSLGRKERIQ